MKHRLLNLFTVMSSISLAIAALVAIPQLAVARELSKIEAKGELKVAVKDNLRPLGFTNKEGNLVGLEIDLARKLAEELLGDPQAIELIAVDNQERLQMVLEDRVDIVIARVSVTASRNRIVDFSPHYYLDGTAIITNNPEIKDVRDLTRKKIAILKNSQTIAVVRHKLPDTILVGVDSYQAALELIANKQADAFAGDRSILIGWMQEHPTYKLLSARLSGAALAVVMPKGLQYQELRSQVDLAIYRWKKSGWLQERIEYWGL